MSNEKKTNEQTNSPFGWSNGLTDSFRDIVSIQFRTAQAVMDKSMGLGQTWTDFVQNQMHEGMKLSQEYLKYGWTLTESVKKSAFEATDRAFRAPTT